MSKKKRLKILSAERKKGANAGLRRTLSSLMRISTSHGSRGLRRVINNKNHKANKTMNRMAKGLRNNRKGQLMGR